MATETVTFFFALLALALAAGLFTLGGALVIGGAGGRAAVASVREVSLELATLVAVTCTAGSLYLSEIANFHPCRLCWVQRGFMYPAAALLIVALVSKRTAPAKVAGALALLGLPVSLFHRWEQAAGEVGGLCDAANPCSARWVNHVGFVTIPTMAAVGFVGVLSLVLIRLSWRSE